MQVSPYCSQATISEHDAHVANQMLLLLTFIIVQYTMPTYIVDSLISNALNDDGRFTPTAPCENIELQLQSLRVTKSPPNGNGKTSYLQSIHRLLSSGHRVAASDSGYEVESSARAEEFKRF
jgi:hypothetical protein